jgi:sugar O-acyltransferase (sialic acid O-acetyltransferase NeuD family)
VPAKLTVTRPPDFIEFRKESILQGIHQRFEDQVRLHPPNIAMKSRDCVLTYAETNGFANSIAAEILSATGKEPARVALLLPNTTETILSMLASLKAHKAYVPLDHNFPLERLKIMLADAEPAVLLTDNDHLELAQELAGKNVEIINISGVKRHADAPNPQVACDPLDLAYILYTSGSTGRPKGIAFVHRNLLHTTMCLANQLYFSPSDRVTWLHSPSFGSSVVDIYCCLLNGGALLPWDAKTQGFTGMSEWLVKERATTFQWIPSAFRQFIRTVPGTRVFRDVRIVVMAGEPLTIKEVDLFRRHFPEGSHLVNQVGTGESYNYYLYSVDHRIPLENASVPGGYPVSEDRKLLILGDDLQPSPPGSVGEIAIQSDYMAAGYWRDDVLTKANFIKLNSEPTPVYLTGDLGRVEPDGCLIHLGRKDFQVKVRGCRVEVAEVEYFLNLVGGIEDSAVWIARNRLGDDQLVGYVVLKPRMQVLQAEVEHYLEARLPDYMVPRHYTVLDSLPALPTGKVNRKALPNPFGTAPTPARAPSSETASIEQEVLRLFKDVLKMDDITFDSDFIACGGDSLVAAVLAHLVHQKYHVEIGFEEFKELPTPAFLAKLIAAALMKRDEKGAGWEATKPPGAMGKIELEPLHATRREFELRNQAEVPVGNKALNLIIISAGKFGREAFAWAVQAMAAGADWRVKGFLDDRRNALGGYDYPVPILGDVASYQIQSNDVFVGAIGDPKDKVKYYSPILERGGRFVNLIHPLANIGVNVRLGTGIILGPFASVTVDATIGNHVSIGAFSNAAHDTVIGDWCQISSHCGINGKAILGKGVFLGSHACIIPGIQVGAWAFVGAGSVVIKDIEPGVRVFGNPAAPIGRAALP